MLKPFVSSNMKYCCFKNKMACVIEIASLNTFILTIGYKLIIYKFLCLKYKHIEIIKLKLSPSPQKYKFCNNDSHLVKVIL